MPEERRLRNPYSKFRFVIKTVGKAHFNSDNPNHIEYDIRKVGMEWNVRNTQKHFFLKTLENYIHPFQIFVYVKNTQVFQYRRVHVCRVNTIKQIHNKS